MWMFAVMQKRKYEVCVAARLDPKIKKIWCIYYILAERCLSAMYLRTLMRVLLCWHAFFFNKIALARTHKPLFENTLYNDIARIAHIF